MNLKTRTGTVHAAAPNGKHPLCGAGNISVGTRRRSSYAKTDAQITCKTCLRKLAEQESLHLFNLEHSIS